MMTKIFKVPLVLAHQPEGGFTVTSPVLPELLTEGDTLDEARSNAQDALTAAVELYEDMGRSLPSGIEQDNGQDSIPFEWLVAR